MRSQELLTALMNGPQRGDFVGIYQTEHDKLVAFTGLQLDEAGDLVLYSAKQQPPLAMKDFYTQLMLHKNRYLMQWQKGKKQPIYGFKEVDRKIVI
ncbi:hypothetical protein [Enterococcus sp. LJL90]